MTHDRLSTCVWHHRAAKRDVFQSAYNYAIMIAAESCIAGALHWFGRALLDASESDRDNMVATFLSHEIGAVRAPVAHAAWDRVARPDRNRYKSCWTLKVFLRMTRSGQYTATGRPLLSRLLLLFMLVAFAVQGFAVQTHIHGAAASANSSITHVSAPSQPGPQDPYDPANCPLCQEMLHAGIYVAPVVADFTVILNAVAFAPAYALLPHAAAERQHSWQSRAPPRH